MSTELLYLQIRYEARPIAHFCKILTEAEDGISITYKNNIFFPKTISSGKLAKSDWLTSRYLVKNWYGFIYAWDCKMIKEDGTVCDI